MSDTFPSYPEIPAIANLYPGPQALLGRRIHWTEKRDGSNLRIALVDDAVRVASRHQDEASEQFLQYYLSTPQAPRVEELLRWHSGNANSPAGDFNIQPVVFGELLIGETTRGGITVRGHKSPARFEWYDRNELVIFDIWDGRAARFLPYSALYQYCYHFALPVVECWGLSQHSTLEDLYHWRDEMLDMAREWGREGGGLKAFDGPRHSYAKEKLDSPKIPRVSMDTGAPVLPCLPDSEVWGAINKVHVDLGEAFRDKAQAMPRIAAFVAEEQRKHLCGKPGRSLFAYYQEYLEEESQ